MSRALLGPYTSTRGLNHTPDGLPVCAARIAEGKKEDSYYAALDKTSHDFLRLVFDVFCGTAPRVDEFLRRVASIDNNNNNNNNKHAYAGIPVIVFTHLRALLVLLAQSN
jgi:hypothetical protein